VLLSIQRWYWHAAHSESALGSDYGEKPRLPAVQIFVRNMLFKHLRVFTVHLRRHLRRTNNPDVEALIPNRPLTVFFELRLCGSRAARALRDALPAFGLEVWYDKALGG